MWATPPQRLFLLHLKAHGWRDPHIVCGTSPSTGCSCSGRQTFTANRAVCFFPADGCTTPGLTSHHNSCIHEAEKLQAGSGNHFKYCVCCTSAGLASDTLPVLPLSLKAVEFIQCRQDATHTRGVESHYTCQSFTIQTFASLHLQSFLRWQGRR